MQHRWTHQGTWPETLLSFVKDLAAGFRSMTATNCAPIVVETLYVYVQKVQARKDAAFWKGQTSFQGRCLFPYLTSFETRKSHASTSYWKHFSLRFRENRCLDTDDLRLHYCFHVRPWICYKAHLCCNKFRDLCSTSKIGKFYIVHWACCWNGFRAFLNNHADLKESKTTVCNGLERIVFRFHDLLLVLKTRYFNISARRKVPFLLNKTEMHEYGYN